MKRKDLNRLDALVLAPARAVVPMRDIYEGATDPAIVGLRHDVDDNEGSLDTAVRIARWEHERGYRATFFWLHTAPYWQRDDFAECLHEVANLGHEIGIHANAIPAALATDGDPATILLDALEQLRGMGHTVVGVAGHGDKACRDEHGTVTFVNDEIFTECVRPEMGAPDRTITRAGATLRLQPRPLADFGLKYETYRLPRGRYLSDSGGHWSEPFAAVSDIAAGQLHVLWHPDWWAGAL